ncbi:MAG: HEAT repeat domain-containing protein [Planctomycetota bacterium]
MKANRTVIGLFAALGLAGVVLAGWWVLGGDPSADPVDPVGPRSPLEGVEVPDRTTTDLDPAPPRDIDEPMGPAGAVDEDDLRDLEGPATGEASYEEILAAVESGNWREVERLMRMGGGNADERVTDLILKNLGHQQWRNMASELARYLKHPSAMGKLLDMAKGDGKDWTRAAAILAASHVAKHQGGTGLTETASELLKGAKSGSVLAARAAQALGVVGTEEAARTLVKALRSARGFNDGALLAAIGSIENETTLATLGSMAAEEEDAALRRSLVEALGRTRNPALEDDILRISRGDTDPDVRREALAALGLMNTPTATQELINVMQGGEAADQLEAARALGNIKSRAAAPSIRKAVESASDDKKLAYLIPALGTTRDPDSIEMLNDLATDSDRSAGIRKTAVKALGDVGHPDAADPIIDILAGTPASDHSMFRTAVQAIGKVGRKEDLPRLQKILEGVPEKTTEHLVLKNTINSITRGPIVRLPNGPPVKPR